MSFLLLTPEFTHGQLYVAISRTRSHDDLKIILPKSTNEDQNRMLCNLCK